MHGRFHAASEGFAGLIGRHQQALAYRGACGVK
jgi:hypothetical protein